MLTVTDPTCRPNPHTRNGCPARARSLGISLFIRNNTVAQRSRSYRQVPNQGQAEGAATIPFLEDEAVLR